MSRLRVKLSDKRNLNVNAPDLKRKFWPFYLLELVQYVTLSAGAVVFVYGIFHDNFDNVELFKLMMVNLVIIGGAQLIKMILGGFRYFPESRFDLFSLVFLIGLISTLLVKQFADLVTNEGMFPDRVYWHFTIWGFLMLLANGYLLDVISRNTKWLCSLGVFVFALFEMALAIQFISVQDINEGEAFFVLSILPLLIIPVIYFKGLVVKALMAANVLLISVLSFLNLPEDFVLFSAFASGLISIGLIGFGILKLDDIKTFVRALQSRSAKKIMDKRFIGILVVFLTVVLSLASFVLLVTGKDFVVFTDALESTNDAVYDTVEVHEFLIGKGFSSVNLTTSLNIYSSYGILGLVLMMLLFGTAIYSGLKLFKEKLSFTVLAIAWTGLLVIVSMFFITISSIAWALLFLLMGVTSALYAINKKITVKHGFAKIKKLEGNTMKVYLLARVLSVVLILAGAGYVFLNIEEIFLK